MTVLNKNSWHYRLVSKWGDPVTRRYLRDSDTYNFCSYFKSVGVALLAVIFVVLGCVIGAAACLYLVGDPIYYLVKAYMRFVLHRPVDMTITLGAGAVGIILMSMAILICIVYIKRKFVPDDIAESPGFVSSAWHSFKNKVCFNVTFK